MNKIFRFQEAAAWGARLLVLTAMLWLGVAQAESAGEPRSQGDPGTGVSTAVQTNGVGRHKEPGKAEAGVRRGLGGEGLASRGVEMSFWLNHIELFQVEVWGNPLWKYLASLLYVVLAYYVSKLLDFIVQVYLRRWARQTETKFDDLLLEILHGPVKVIVFVVLLHMGLRFYDWPEWEADYISNALKIVVACSLTYVAIKSVDLAMGLWQQRAEAAQEGLLDMHLFPILRKTFKVLVIIVAVLMTSANLGMNITSLLASLSIGGLAVGLAAQDTLSNLFGAVAIFADKPFRVGDRIQIDTIDGTVEVIGLRSTRVRNQEGYLVTIPNKNMANANIINISKRPNIKTTMNIGITYDTPSPQVERAMEIIREVYRSHPKTADLLVSFDKFDSSALNLLVIHWWNSRDWNEYIQGIQKLNLELKRRFDAEGINFAFPSQTVYLRQDSQWELAAQHRAEPGPAGAPARPAH